MTRYGAAVLLVATVFAPIRATASTVDFTDEFSYPDGTNLDGDNGWGVSGSGSATATNGNAEIVDATLTNAFTGGETELWTELRAEMVQGDATTSNPPPGSTYSFYVNTDSNLVVYSGTNTYTLDAPAIPTGIVTYTIRSIYSNATWDLYVNNSLATNGLSFFDTNVTEFTEFGLVSATDTTRVDRVAMTLAAPLPVPDASFAPSATNATILESAGVVTVAVELTSSFVEAIEIDYARTAGTATPGTDFNGYSDGTLTFAAGETSKSFSFNVVDDTEEESAETVEFSLTTGTNVTLVSPTNVTFTIASDAADWNLPFLEPFDGLTNGPLAVQHGWLGSNAVVQSTVTSNSTRAGSITSSAGSAYHSFSDGQTNVWTDFYMQPVLGDDTTPTPPAGTAFAFYVNTNGNVVVYSSNTVVTTAVTVVEHVWTRFTVYSDYSDDTWDLYVDGEIKEIGLGFIDTGADAYTEFGLIGGGGESNAPVDEIAITLTSPFVTPIPTGSFAVASADYDESAGTVTVSVQLASIYAETVEVDFARTGGSATPVDDFTGYSDATLSFAPGETNKGFSFTIVDDTDEESDETIEFSLTGGTNVTLAVPTNMTVTINSDPGDAISTGSFAVASAAYDEDGGSVTVTVQLSSAYFAAVEVDYARTGGDATPGSDFTGYSDGTLTFAIGETSKSFSFNIVDDGDEESAETIEFSLTGGTNVILAVPTNMTVTINSDPGDWSLPFLEPFDGLTNGPLVVQHGWLGSNAVVQSTVTSNSTRAGSITSSAGSAYHTFSDGQTNVWTDFYLQPVLGDDTTPTPSAGTAFAFYVNTNGNIVVYDGAAVVTTAVAVVEHVWTRFSVYSDYTDDTWDLYVDGVVAQTGLGFFDTGADAYTEFGLIGGGGESNAPVDEIAITLTAPFVFPIPTGSLATASAAYDEDAGSVTVVVLLTGTYPDVVKVDYAQTGGSATLGSDFNGYSDGTLTFAPGETNKSFGFTIIDDTDEESDETIEFSLTGGTNVTLVAPTNVTFTISSDPNDWNLPFVEPFDGLVDAPLATQHGWLGSNAIVQSTTTYNSSARAGSLTSTASSAYHNFSDGQTRVWTDFYLQPVFGDGSTPAPPSGSAFAFYVNSESNVVVYSAGSAITTGVTVVESQWTRFTVLSDYSDDSWHLYVDASLAAGPLAFNDASANSYTEFGMIGGNGVAGLVDDINIDLSSPPGIPLATLFLVR